VGTVAIHREDPYARQCEGFVTRIADDGVELDRTVFYPLGGGQAGDAGTLLLGEGTTLDVIDARKSRRDDATPDDTLHLLDPESGWQDKLAVGTAVSAHIDWERRYRHMRFHTATHLLCAVVHELVARSLPVGCEWISDDELRASPQLVRSMSVSPPLGFGRVRLVRIGEVDLQPCGGTHVRNTAEIGAVRVAKIEKKSARTRRVVLEFA